MTSLQISQYSLYNIENYNTNLSSTINDILNKYNLLIIEYFKLNIKGIKEWTRGLETISHVFEIMLYYTKNLDMTYYQSQKAFYFYGEFISQIIEDPNNYLQLSSKDATLFVYKKTIFEINAQIQKGVKILTDLDKTKLDILNSYISILKKICENKIPKHITLILENLNNSILTLDKENYELILLFIQRVNKEEDNVLLFIKILHSPFDKRILKKNIETYDKESASSNTIKNMLIDLFIE
jgi:hypothetical protein